MSNSFVKDNWDQLAIFGGRPLFDIPVHVNQPNVGKKEVFDSYLDKAWKSRWFTNDGPNVRELESRLCDYLQVDHCILTCNGTAAMALAIQALELKGEVIVPAFTFISTPHMLQSAGIRTVFCDINPDDSNINHKHCETLITPDTSAIIGTHTWGNPCDIPNLQKLCTRENIHLIFDAAHAFGCTHDNTPIARFGNAEVFSFHATKTFHTIEGGAVTTNDDVLATRLRKSRNFGFSNYDRVEMLGTNAKMSEVHAAMGLTNLQSIDSNLKESKVCHDSYSTGLESIPGVDMHKPNVAEISNYHYVVAMVCHEKFGLNRDQLLQILHAENILARRYFYPGAHQCEPYRSLFPHNDEDLPHTTKTLKQVIVLPGGANMSKTDVSRICALMQLVGSKAEKIAVQLKEHDPTNLAE